MEVFKRLGMVIDPLHVTKLRQQSLVTNYSTILTLTILEYHLESQNLRSYESLLLIIFIEQT